MRNNLHTYVILMINRVGWLNGELGKDVSDDKPTRMSLSCWNATRPGTNTELATTTLTQSP
jgi:hypothetical protein